MTHRDDLAIRLLTCRREAARDAAAAQLAQAERHAEAASHARDLAAESLAEVRLQRQALASRLSLGQSAVLRAAILAGADALIAQRAEHVKRAEAERDQALVQLEQQRRHRMAAERALLRLDQWRDQRRRQQATEQMAQENRQEEEQQLQAATARQGVGQWNNV